MNYDQAPRTNSFNFFSCSSSSSVLETRPRVFNGVVKQTIVLYSCLPHTFQSAFQNDSIHTVIKA